MRKTLSKLLSVALSVTMVFSSAILSDVKADDEMTTEQMVASAQYNLALKKNVQVMPSMQEGSASFLTDGAFTPGGNHAATTFGKSGTYYQIDLGQPYELSTLDQLVVGYKENNDGDIPTKGYKIQISANGLDFTDAKKVDGAHVKDACANNNLIEVTSLSDAEGTAVRYIRLYYPDSYTWGVQVTEIAVLDTNLDAKVAEVEKCADAAGVTVTTPDYNTVSYTIQLGENQEDYKYIVYLLNGVNDKIIGNGVEAGKEYTVDNLFSGYWTIKVIACYNGAASDGITSERFEIPEISNVIREKRNISNAQYPYNYPARIVDMSSIYDGHTLDTAQAALDSIPNTGEGPTVAMRTGAGEPQYFVIDLGDYYTPSEMSEVMLAYTNANTYASNVKVEFSLDGNKYTEVGNKKDYKFAAKSDNFCAYNRVKLSSIDKYTEKAVRFVKVTLSGGVSGWGYVINEVCVLANTDEPTIVGSNIPEAADVIVDTSAVEKIKYTIVEGENQKDATYVVTLNGKTINSSAKAGVEYTYETSKAGDYELKVSTLEDGWMSKGIKKTVSVDGYINYVNTSLNLALKSKHYDVVATCDNDNTGDNYLAGSQDISAGVGALNNGYWMDFAHHTGYLQTRPDNDEANIVYDLGKEYNKDDVHSLIAMYETTNNAATEYEIFVSKTGEDDTYEKVFETKKADYSTFKGETRPVFTNDVLDMSKYTGDTVRFVKYHIITGNYGRHYNADGSINWGSDGYHLVELAVMGTDSLLPDAPKNVTVESPAYDTITVKWEDIADKDATYNIYVDNQVKMEVSSGKQEATFKVQPGTRVVKVGAVVNGMERISDEKSVFVQTETTTQKPTTKPAETTTKEPTTPKVTNPTTAKPLALKKPGKARILKAVSGKKKVSLKFKRVKGANGYRVKYSLKSNFKQAKTVTTKKVNITLKKLKKGKRYYIKVQAYKIFNGKKIYGAFSNKVRTKKVK